MQHIEADVTSRVRQMMSRSALLPSALKMRRRMKLQKTGNLQAKTDPEKRMENLQETKRPEMKAEPAAKKKRVKRKLLSGNTRIPVCPS